MVTLTITLLNDIYKRNIKSTGTATSVLRILETLLSTTHFSLLVAKLTTRECGLPGQSNDGRTDGSKRPMNLQVFIANNIKALLTDNL